MKSPTGPHLVIGHSMGTVIAYDCLKRVASCPAIDGIMTLGSPLGLKEVQEHLTPEWTRENGYPTEKVHGNWWNIYDRLDVVCGFDPKLGNDFLESGHPKVRDIYQKNDGWWRHHIAKYFVEEPLRNALKNLLGLQEK